MSYVLKQTMKAAAGLAVIFLIGASALMPPAGEERFACAFLERDCQ